jgi:hypothetical protein
MKKILLILFLLLPITSWVQYHTDTSKWKEPRIFPKKEIVEYENGIKIKKRIRLASLIQAGHALNKGYFPMLCRPDTSKPALHLLSEPVNF